MGIAHRERRIGIKGMLCRVDPFKFSITYGFPMLWIPFYPPAALN